MTLRPPRYFLHAVAAEDVGETNGLPWLATAARPPLGSRSPCLLALLTTTFDLLLPDAGWLMALLRRQFLVTSARPRTTARASGGTTLRATWRTGSWGHGAAIR